MQIDERVARLMEGREPEFDGMPLSLSDGSVAYGWYHKNRTKDEIDSYLKKFCIEQDIDVPDRKIQEQISTVGITARMIMRGAELPESSLDWFNRKIEKLMSDDSSPSKTVEKPKLEEKRINVEDPEQKFIGLIIGELDGLIDDYIMSGLEELNHPSFILNKYTIKPSFKSKIIKYFTKQKNEIEIALERRDDLLTEAYAPYYRPDLKKIYDAYALIITTIEGVQVETAAKKPRKTRPKSPEKMTSKLKYCPSIPELQIKSVKPEKFIGAEELWVYNIKTRKLGCYYSKDANGLSVKGQTILNYDEEKSICKTIRKPEEFLPVFMNTRKNALKRALDGVRAVEGVMSGRMGNDIILLKVNEF